MRVTGDPATLLVEPGASPDDIETMRHQFGLDQPLWVQYWLFMASFATGDLGQSFYYRTPVLELYFQRLPNSLLLAAVAMALSLLIGIPSGILAAVRVGGFWDSAGKIFALLGLSLPSVLGRPGADPVLLGLSRLAAVLRLRHRGCIC